MRNEQQRRRESTQAQRRRKLHGREKRREGGGEGTTRKRTSARVWRGKGEGRKGGKDGGRLGLRGAMKFTGVSLLKDRDGARRSERKDGQGRGNGRLLVRCLGMGVGRSKQSRARRMDGWRWCATALDCVRRGVLTRAFLERVWFASINTRHVQTLDAMH